MCIKLRGSLHVSVVLRCLIQLCCGSGIASLASCSVITLEIGACLFEELNLGGGVGKAFKM